MAWNSTHAKYKSTGPGTNGGLAGLDCGYAIKHTPRPGDSYWAEFTTPTGGIEPGACVAMIRIPGGTTIAGGELFCTALGANDQTPILLAVGDPYACARLLGPCCATVGSWVRSAANGSALDLVSFDCFKMRRVGNVGDGCGIGYKYTCETDIIVTNIYNSGYAAMGGWAGGGYTASASQSTSATNAGAKIILRIDVLPVQ